MRVLDTEPDAYLVVAADKGTAQALRHGQRGQPQYGHWLGDAFASGGSAGYDHKELGITAKGAWESVKRHFRELGHDVATEPFTVVGIGDMSGDVFGNGMLLSPVIRLVAAFDHRHVFLDPEPDPAPALAERRRLFELAGSSWDDYDRALISDGGGVWPRCAKSVPLSPQVRARAGHGRRGDVAQRALPGDPAAPVDLFWNGGIGTFVKAEDETNVDVGDRANDALRVERRRAAGAGGGGGRQPRDSPSAAGSSTPRAGGRINTDAIDNSAGVDCSDHEVNLKILLAQAVEAGELTMPGRNELLEQVVDHVVAHVLYDNYLQVQILSQESEVAAQRMEYYEELMPSWRRPGCSTASSRRCPRPRGWPSGCGAGSGMVRPRALCAAGICQAAPARPGDRLQRCPTTRTWHGDLAEYFPGPVVERFGCARGAPPAAPGDHRAR